MQFDLRDALEKRLQSQHPSAALPADAANTLSVTALALQYSVLSSHPSAQFRSLLRIRSRNQTDIAQRHAVRAHVPETFSVQLPEIAWPVPVEVELPPPPRLERPAMRVHAGNEVTRRCRRSLHAQLSIPPGMEILSEFSYRPLAMQGTIQGQLRVRGTILLNLSGGEVVRLIDERFPLDLGTWSALGVEEVLLEDKEAVKISL